MIATIAKENITQGVNTGIGLNIGFFLGDVYEIIFFFVKLSAPCVISIQNK